MSNAPLAIERPLSLDSPLEMDDARIASRRAATIRHEAIRDYLRLQKELAQARHAARVATARAWAEAFQDGIVSAYPVPAKEAWVKARVAPEELEASLKESYVRTQSEYIKELAEERSQLKSLIEWSMRLDPSWNDHGPQS